jgi:hypothetical protein
MRRAFVIVIVVMTLCGATWCAYAARTSHAMHWWEGVAHWPSYRSAIAQIDSSLNDEESARFKDLYLSDGVKGSSLCGTVNAKNRMGAYVGFRHFYIPSDHSKAFKIQRQEFSELSIDWMEDWSAHCTDGRHSASLE